MPTFGSLFAGIGGIDLGLERAGWECRWQVEIDQFCQAVLEKHWPDVPRFGDVRELTGDELEPVDLIAGGFPCQPVSLAGKRRGQDDERWLWPEFERVVRLLRPRLVFVENVPGLLVRGMGDVLGGLATLGYDTEWDCIPAAAVGAPHLRYRVLIVAHATRQRRSGQVEPRSDMEHDGLQPAFVRAGAPDQARDVADPNGARSQGRYFGGERTRECVVRTGCLPDTRDWLPEPDVGRVATGVPRRVDRLRTLGNSVVPQVAEWIGRRLMETA